MLNPNNLDFIQQVKYNESIDHQGGSNDGLVICVNIFVARGGHVKPHVFGYFKARRIVEKPSLSMAQKIQVDQPLWLEQE